ncbi:hypothetical protein [Bacteroides sp. 224]|uniref:hypothetical protein n=1 Tax=Bacteroides sp. 224 TaxID=2302936 RepID=UPI0013D2073B|nr:hypothetical protein [Bacteroides sp. 224]
MAYKWRPSKTQKRDFAQKMKNDPDYREAYYSRKDQRAKNRRSTSKYEYESAGGYYIPTKAQHDFCAENMHLFVSEVEKLAANTVMHGYSCNEKIHHDDIHIVNEKIRSNSK